MFSFGKTLFNEWWCANMVLYPNDSNNNRNQSKEIACSSTSELKFKVLEPLEIVDVKIFLKFWGEVALTFVCHQSSFIICFQNICPFEHLYVNAISYFHIKVISYIGCVLL